MEWQRDTKGRPYRLAWETTADNRPIRSSTSEGNDERSGSKGHLRPHGPISITMGGYQNERLSCSFIHDRKRVRERGKGKEGEGKKGRVSVFQTHQEVIVWESWQALCPSLSVCLCCSGLSCGSNLWEMRLFQGRYGGEWKLPITMKKSNVFVCVRVCVEASIKEHTLVLVSNIGLYYPSNNQRMSPVMYLFF